MELLSSSSSWDPDTQGRGGSRAPGWSGGQGRVRHRVGAKAGQGGAGHGRARIITSFQFFILFLININMIFLTPLKQPLY